MLGGPVPGAAWILKRGLRGCSFDGDERDGAARHGGRRLDRRRRRARRGLHRRRPRPRARGGGALRLATRVDAVSAAVRSSTFTPMTQEDAEAIADWRYEPPYDFYDARATIPASSRCCSTRRVAPTARSPRATRTASSSASSRTPPTATRSRSVSGCGRTAPAVASATRSSRKGSSSRAPGTRRPASGSRRRGVQRACRQGVRAVRVRAHARRSSHETNGGMYPFIEMERPA